MRPGSEFSYEAAKSKLMNLKLESQSAPRMSFLAPGDGAMGEELESETPACHQGRVLLLSSSVDMESRLTVRSPPRANATDASDRLRRRAAELSSEAACSSLSSWRFGRFQLLPRMPFANVHSARHHVGSPHELATVSLCRFINADTLRSLQIVQSESHPHLHNQGPTNATSGSKEGLSVYGLFQHLARTPQGRHLLRQWFLRPSLDLDVIRERHETVSILLCPENAEPLEGLAKNLHSVKNMRVTMVSLRRGVVCGASRGPGIARSTWAALREVRHIAFLRC